MFSKKIVEVIYLRRGFNYLTACVNKDFPVKFKYKEIKKIDCFQALSGKIPIQMPSIFHICLLGNTWRKIQFGFLQRMCDQGWSKLRQLGGFCVIHENILVSLTSYFAFVFFIKRKNDISEPNIMAKIPHLEYLSSIAAKLIDTSWETTGLIRESLLSRHCHFLDHWESHNTRRQNVHDSWGVWWTKKITSLSRSLMVSQMKLTGDSTYNRTDLHTTAHREAHNCTSYMQNRSKWKHWFDTKPSHFLYLCVTCDMFVLSHENNL